MMAGIEAIVKGSCMKLSLLGYAKDALKILFFVGVKATSSMLIKLWKNCGKPKFNSSCNQFYQRNHGRGKGGCNGFQLYGKYGQTMENWNCYYTIEPQLH